MPIDDTQGLRRTSRTGQTLSPTLKPGNTVFAVLSFEGPDLSSQAGGLGVRVSELAHVLAELGHETHLFFLGDPRLMGEERRVEGRLVLHRWAQWLSVHHPGGVYDGEEAKLHEFSTALPVYLTDRVIRPAIAEGRVPVVLSEEWQTAECACRLSDHLHALGLRDRTVMLWNANNPYSFDRVDWPRLAFTNTVTAVSRYMRGIIRARGADALVIPNGIPRRLTKTLPDAGAISLLRSPDDALLFFKMARWERDKGWSQALDAIRRLRERGRRVTLVARSGGPANLGGGVGAEAELRGLRVIELHDAQGAIPNIAEAVRSGAEVVSLRFGVNEQLARALYAAADGVWANSISEPFGLVGLEAMAAGGVVYTGGTGEDYAISGRNAVVLQTLDPDEIADRSEELAQQPERTEAMRRAAQRTARRYTWRAIAQLLMARVAEQATRQGALPKEAGCYLSRVAASIAITSGRAPATAGDFARTERARRTPDPLATRGRQTGRRPGAKASV